jgi:hypothetical protein
MKTLDHLPNLSRVCRRLIRRGGALGLAIAVANSMAWGAAPPLDEYTVKAAFLVNFTQFVEWPPGAFQSADDSIAICVLGQDPFGHSLEERVARRAIEGRPLAVRHVSGVKQGAGCHVLFIGSAENKRSSPLLAELKTPGILTIGESDDSAMDGVVINFKLQGGKVRFEINLEAAEREKLRISSRLLSLALVVDPTRK